MKNQSKITQKLLPFLMLSLLGSSTSVYADDTEAFFVASPSASNVLFLMDSSGSMNWDLSGKDSSQPGYALPTRMSILQNALTEVFAQAPSNLNVGLMTYGASNGEKTCPTSQKNDFCFVTESKRDFGIHGVTLPITAIDDSAATALGIYANQSNQDNLPDPGTKSIREFIPDVANSWSAEGPSPIVDALYEAALYFRGDKMRWGQDIPTSDIAAHPSTYEGPAITQNRSAQGIDPASAPKYKSPITSECQSNYIVLMTDGIPSYYYTGGNKDGKNTGPAGAFFGDSSVSTLAGAVGAITSSSGDGGAGTGAKGNLNPRGFKSGEGGYELIRYISQNDNNPDVDGINTIDTFVVGFGPTLRSNEREYLETLTSIDDPDTQELEGYYEAQDAEALARSFKDILEIISKKSISYASPGYSVNVKSGLEHERDVYVPMFDRTNSSVWPGNLKKFRINEASGKRVIQDKNSVNAVDELGSMTDEAIDFWSSATSAEPDGKEVQKGGVANLLPAADERKVLSNLACTGGCVLTELIETNAEDNGLITNNLLGLDPADTTKANPTYRKQLISFIRGKKADGSQRYHLGDMMHSEPLVVTYDAGSSDGTGKQQYIFVATNEGYLHAFDTATGAEKFAFMPAELLKNIEPQYNSGSAKDHKYGIDGGMTYWEKSSSEKYLYFGMRRGGSSYYVLDVSDINAPFLKWTKSNADSGFENMGQSWSTPYLAKVGVNGVTKEVMIVSGGYDEADDRDLRTFCSKENGTCTIPANTAATVWYGANDTWVSKSFVTGSINCNNSVFGDPLVGVFKSCEIELNNGGYDSQTPVTVDKGNDIFIMDALTGAKIWSLQSDSSITAADKANLTSSVPGGLRMLDTNYNKLVDRLYFADTGGYVWRLDLSEKIGDSGHPSKLTEFADLGDVGNADARKFYNEPDVSLMKLNGKSVFVVSVGSGFRAHPLDKTLNDKFYMLVDKVPYGTADKASIVESKLSTITISDSPASINPEVEGIQHADSKGWVIALPKNGEKVLGTALAFDGVITFTTLVPEPLAHTLIDPCNPPVTHGRLYSLNILTGEAGLDLNEDGTITDADLFIDIASGDIPGKPQQVFNPLAIEDVVGDDGLPSGDKSCSHPVDIRIGKKLSQATGYDACRLESVYWSDPVSTQ